MKTILYKTGKTLPASANKLAEYINNLSVPVSATVLADISEEDETPTFNVLLELPEEISEDSIFSLGYLCGLVEDSL